MQWCDGGVTVVGVERHLTDQGRTEVAIRVTADMSRRDSTRGSEQ